MPHSSTATARACARSTIVERFRSSAASGSPRSPSFAPSARIMIDGLRASASPTRVTPSALVSPLMLWLSIVQPGWLAWRRSCRTAGNAFDFDGETARLSPTTTTIRVATPPAGEGAAGDPQASAVRIRGTNQWNLDRRTMGPGPMSRLCPRSRRSFKREGHVHQLPLALHLHDDRRAWLEGAHGLPELLQRRHRRAVDAADHVPRLHRHLARGAGGAGHDDDAARIPKGGG